MEEIEFLLDRCKPDILIAGYSAYSHHYDYKAMKAAADKHGAYLMADMAHISGLVAGKVAPSPFDHCDIVTTTTHKSLQCNRGALIFYRKGVRSESKNGEKIMYDLEERINNSVFPGHQGGPHMHSIAGIAVGLKLATTPEFKEYSAQVVANAKILSQSLHKMGLPTVNDDTLNHMMLINLRGRQVDGARVDFLCEKVNITINKNTIPGIIRVKIR